MQCGFCRTTGGYGAARHLLTCWFGTHRLRSVGSEPMGRFVFWLSALWHCPLGCWPRGIGSFFGLAVRFNRTTGGYGAARHLSDLSVSRSMDCDLWVLSRWVFCVVFWPGTFLVLSIRFWVKRQQVHFRTIPCGRQTVQRAATARSGTECLFGAARKTREPCKKGAGEPKNR